MKNIIISEMKRITVVLKSESKGQYTVAITEMAQEDANNYAAKIKEMGYNGEFELADRNSIITSVP